MGIDALIKQGGRDLADDIADGRVPNLSFRELESERVRDALDRRKSVLIVGPDGVGKSSLVYRVTAQYHKPIYRFSTTDVMSGTKYLGEWETKISEILRAAQTGGIGRRITDSIATKTNRPPSRAGIGKRLITARLSEITAIK